MPLISVLTPTIRGKEGLKRPKESLENQSFKGFEWLIEKHDPKKPFSNKRMQDLSYYRLGSSIYIRYFFSHTRTSNTEFKFLSFNSKEVTRNNINQQSSKEHAPNFVKKQR
jgi:hypothetical protein